MSTLVRAAAVAALLLASAAGVTSAAPPATPEGAAAIRAGLEGWIAEWLGPQGSASIVFSAPIAVAAQGPFYAVKIPSLTATVGGPDKSAITTIAVDAIDLRLTPQSAEVWAVDWRLPARIGVMGGDGTKVEVTFGSQSGSGTYSTALDTFTALDVRLADIAAAPVAPRAGENGEVAIEELFLTLSADEATAGLWDAEGAVGLRGLFIHEVDATSDTKFTLGALDGRIGASGLDVAALLAFIRGVVQVDLPAAGADGAGALGGVADLMDTTPKLLDTFEIGWSVSDFAVTDQYGDGSVGKAAATVLLDGVRADTATAHITATMADLDLPDFGAAGDLTPRLVNVDLTIEEVPSTVLTGALKEAFRNGAALGPEGVFELAAMQVYAALTSGQGVVRFDELLVDFPRVGIDLAGRVWSAENSIVGFAADMMLTIGGYKALYDLLDEAIGEDAEATQFLTAFEVLGQPAVDEQGRQGRRYQLLIDEATGAVTFNGTNIETLLQ
jgi:hypothetical protein